MVDGGFKDLEVYCPCGEQMVIDDISLPIVVLRAVTGWLAGTILQHCPKCGERMGEGYNNASDINEFKYELEDMFS